MIRCPVFHHFYTFFVFVKYLKSRAYAPYHRTTTKNETPCTDMFTNGNAPNISTTFNSYESSAYVINANGMARSVLAKPTMPAKNPKNIVMGIKARISRLTGRDTTLNCPV